MQLLLERIVEQVANKQTIAFLSKQLGQVRSKRLKHVSKLEFQEHM